MNSTSTPENLLRLAGYLAYVSGVVGIFGVTFLVLFFAGVGGFFGTLNDIAVIIQYIIMLPMAYILWRYLRPNNPSMITLSLVIGLIGMLVVIVLQTMLVANRIPFNIYIVIVSIGFLVAAVWFVLNGIVGRQTGKLPNGIVWDVLAGLYIGYPVWAFRLGKTLLGG